MTSALTPDQIAELEAKLDARDRAHKRFVENSTIQNYGAAMRASSDAKRAIADALPALIASARRCAEMEKALQELVAAESFIPDYCQTDEFLLPLIAARALLARSSS